MLITVDNRPGRPPSAPREHPPRPSLFERAEVRTPAKMWGITLVVALVCWGMAMAQVTGLGFNLLLGGSHQKAVTSLPHQLPFGKGMWIWQPDKSDGGDAGAIVARAKAVGLTHLYVRTGSSWDGFYAAPFLDKLLPPAHAAGIRVYGWDFPRLIDPDADVARGLAAITYETPGKQRIDGFAPDIETRSEGTHITPEAAIAYADGLRAGAGVEYPLIGCVPRPSTWTKSFYPYVELAARFDALAPMVYWLNREPDSDVAGALSDLKPLGKPVFPVGQAYDGAPEGGRPGPPTPDEIQRFMSVALTDGAMGVSFWSWQAAAPEVWDTIRDAPQFRAPMGEAQKLQKLVLEAG